MGCDDRDSNTCGYMEFGAGKMFVCDDQNTIKHGKPYCCRDSNSLQKFGGIDPCSDGFVGETCDSPDDCQGGNQCAWWSVADIEKTNPSKVCCNGGTSSVRTGRAGNYQWHTLCAGLLTGMQCKIDASCKYGHCDKGFL